MKAKQKLIAAAAAFLMLITVASFTACAAEQFSVTVGTLNSSLGIMPGEEIAVPVYLTGNPGVFSYVFKYRYDNTQLELQTDKMQTLLGKPDYRCLINDFTMNDKNGTLTVVTLHTGKADQTGDGVILYLLFKVKDSASMGFSEITVDYSLGNVCNYDTKLLYPVKISGGLYINGKAQGSSDNQSAVSSTAVSGSASKNTGSQETQLPKGYVPMDTVPATAGEYYKNNTNANYDETLTSEEASTSAPADASSDINNDNNTITSESHQSVAEKGELTGLISKKSLMIIIGVCIAAVAGSVAVYLITNRKKGN